MLRGRLLNAVNSNQTEEAVALLREEPRLCSTTNNARREMVVFQCAENLNFEMLKAFVEAGAPLNQSTWRGATILGAVLGPLLEASWGVAGQQKPIQDREARLNVAKYLLQKGASIHCKSQYGRSPVNAAFDVGDGELLDFLLTNEADPAACDLDGNDVAQLASIWGRTNALCVLASRNVSLEHTNSSGLTPLQAVANIPASAPFRLGWRAPSPLAAHGAKLRDTTFELLLQLGAKPDLLSYIALQRTNDVSAMLARDPKSVLARDGANGSALHWVAQHYNPAIARMLITNGAPLEVINAQCQTPLDLVATIGHIEVAKLFVGAGATLKRPPGMRTPLHLAAERGFLDLVELFVNCGADLEAECDGHLTALDLAARANKENVVRLLVARKAKLKTGGKCMTTPLHWAVANGNTNLISYLLSRGCDIRALDAEGRPVVQIASAASNFELIEFLLAHKAEINARDTNGNTVLHTRMSAEKDVFPAPPTLAFKLSEKLKSKPWAKKAFPGQMFLAAPTRSMMAFLIAHGAIPNATNLLGQTPLHLFAQREFRGTNATLEAMQFIKPLISSKAKVNVVDQLGRTPLHTAVIAANEPVTSTLIGMKSKLDARDADGNTPLHLAAANFLWWKAGLGQTGLARHDLARQLELLVKSGCDVNATNGAGQPPLTLAITNSERMPNDVSSVKTLLLHHASVNLCDTNGRTPFHWACTVGDSCNCLGNLKWGPPEGPTNKFDWWFHCHDEENESDLSLPIMLLQEGAKISVIDRDGNTPLHLATMGYRPGLVKWLVENGADRKARNREGKTAEEIAYDIIPGFLVIPFLQPPHASAEIADAARRGDIESVQGFLAEDRNYANRHWVLETTPLQWACNEGHLEVVKLLVEHGANVNPCVRFDPNRNLTNEANMVFVCQNELRRRGILPKNFLTPMPRADQRKHYSGVETNFYASRPLGKHHRIQLATSPLQLALAGGYMEVVDYLIHQGAEIDTVSAIMLGRNELLRKQVGTNRKILMDNHSFGSWGFWPNGFLCTAENEYEGTPLHFAIRARNIDAAKFLIASGAPLDAKDCDGGTPYDLAKELGFAEMVELLKPLGEQHPQSSKN
jgi:ankyrin repeat protein